MKEIGYWVDSYNKLHHGELKSYNGYFSFYIDDNGEEWKISNERCVDYDFDKIPSEEEIRDDLDEKLHDANMDYLSDLDYE